MDKDQLRESAMWYRPMKFGYVPCEKVEPGVFSSERVVSVTGLEGEVFSGFFDEGSIVAGKLEVLLYAQNLEGTAFLVRPASGDFFQAAALWVSREDVVEAPLKADRHVVYE